MVIDCSGMNLVGGYARNTYSFKFEYGHLSLGNNLSENDLYEKHKSEFYLIERLDVDDVLRLLK